MYMYMYDIHERVITLFATELNAGMQLSEFQTSKQLNLLFTGVKKKDKSHLMHFDVVYKNVAHM